MSDLTDGTKGFSISIPLISYSYAISASVGDVNGDGYGDIIIGLPEGGGSYAMGVIGNMFSNPTAGQHITLNGSNWTFVASGASGDQTNIQSNNNATINQLVSDLNASTDPNISAASYYGCCGAAMAIIYKTAGTVGNSYTMSAGTTSFSPANMWYAASSTLTGGAGNNNLVNAGQTYVLFGAPNVSGKPSRKDGTNWGSSISLPSSPPLDGTNGSEFDGVTAGYQVAAKATGDINGDGITDLVFASSVNGSNSCFVAFGKKSGWTSDYTLDKGNVGSVLDGTQGFEIDDSLNSYGPPIAVGDVNGDGYSDIIMGYYNIWPGGWIYVVYGAPTGSWSGTPFTLASLINGTNGFDLGASGWPNFFDIGWRVAVADVNGDGYADIVSLSYYSDLQAVIFGKSGWPASTTLTNAWFNGINGSEFNLGWDPTSGSVAAGDINGDAIADVIFMGTYVYFGHKNTITNPWPSSAFNLGGL